MNVLQIIYMIGLMILLDKVSHQKFTNWRTGLLQILLGLMWPFVYGFMLILGAVFTAITLDIKSDNFWTPFKMAFRFYSILPYIITNDPAIVEQFYS